MVIRGVYDFTFLAKGAGLRIQLTAKYFLPFSICRFIGIHVTLMLVVPSHHSLKKKGLLEYASLGLAFSMKNMFVFLIIVPLFPSYSGIPQG